MHTTFLLWPSLPYLLYLPCRLSFYVQVDAESVEVQTKEGTEISCRRDEHELRQALHLMVSGRGKKDGERDSLEMKGRERYCCAMFENDIASQCMNHFKVIK